LRESLRIATAEVPLHFETLQDLSLIQIQIFGILFYKPHDLGILGKDIKFVLFNSLDEKCSHTRGESHFLNG